MDKRNTVTTPSRAPVKNTLRIALPPLAEWTDSTPLAYAWLDRQGRVARGGGLPATELAAAFAQARTQVVLHPDDVIVATINVPAVPANRYAAAVRGILEGLVLGDMDGLAIGHGKRAADGTAIVAWTPREALRSAWQRLSAAGLSVQAFYPLQVWSDQPCIDQAAPLHTIEDPRWQAPNPGWSLAVPQLAPRQPSRWRGAAAWMAGAALIWIVGLNIYALQLEHETEQLRQHMEREVRDAFPDIPVVLDPLRQAQQGRDALRTGQGDASGKDLLSLARIAANVLPFATDAVDLLVYQNDALTLRLNDGSQDGPSEPGSSPANELGNAPPPEVTAASRESARPASVSNTRSSDAKTTAADRVADTAAILQRASALGARVERDDKGAWRITRAEP
ncbi:type II secretion system protein GspL [Bordetella genomosp. 4]|uniref:General secretion pathway protein GspL n=1 Tax=Bordetella genomosp. 4 TaxID=463044 RepID=A0A261U4V6_9BORD|nr:type II secretion system protein GspL [Bordetella genomosp. 4]OZI55893.1 general secretion pathway protein GspL [Bordetella genomosp. 4]